MSKKVKCYIVKYKNQADYTVYLCDYKNQQKNHQIIANGELVKYKNQADIKLFLVKYKNQADIIITRENFPKGR